MWHAQEEEQKRISRELHDVIAQSLLGINVHLSVLAKGSAAVQEALRQQIFNMNLLVNMAMTIVHDFARKLRPTMLDDLGLNSALRAFMNEYITNTGIRVSLRAGVMIDQTTTMVRTALYRISQEALTHVARHAKASHVEVSIESLQDVIRMTVQDNGRGFDVSTKAPSKKKKPAGLGRHEGACRDDRRHHPSGLFT